jgi:uncharacterized protein YfaS (alpha-2-macroglobulin family)
MGWLEPRGEILVMMKPDKSLEVIINLEKQTYQPGDLVNYEIQVRSKGSTRLVTDRDVFVSVVATDDSVFSKIEGRKQPPSLGAALYLEGEVKKTQGELYYSNQYIDHYWQ